MEMKNEDSGRIVSSQVEIEIEIEIEKQMFNR